MEKEYIGCSNCKHVSTPKGRQCYTMSRRLKELISDKGRIFSPEQVIPALIEIEKSCSRYRIVAYPDKDQPIRQGDIFYPLPLISRI